MKIHCLLCKKQTETKNFSSHPAKNGRLIGQGECSECKHKKTQFIPGAGGSIKKPKSKKGSGDDVPVGQKDVIELPEKLPKKLKLKPKGPKQSV
jgi:Domain of unknown function (DUF5679)